LDSYLTQQHNLSLPSGQVGSHFVNFENTFNLQGTMFASSYVLGRERCARSRWSAIEGSILYTCDSGVYVRSEIRGLVNLKPGQYRFHLFTNDSVELQVWPYFKKTVGTNDGRLASSNIYTLPGGYTQIYVAHYFNTPTYPDKPWPGEQPRLQLWWENLNEPLQVSLSAEPSSNGAPLFGVNLIADASANPDLPMQFTYTFYCHREDPGTNITTPIDAQFTTAEDTRTAQNLCTYENPGLYTAKVILQRGEEPAAQAQTLIMVSESLEPVPVNGTNGNGTGGGSGGNGTATGTPREVRP